MEERKGGVGKFSGEKKREVRYVEHSRNFLRG
jgi:hypothetical protein